MSQNSDILEALESGVQITPMMALGRYGCFRLGARIYELRKKGHPIKTEMITVKGKRFARYEMQ
jgi:hypothetical protein